MTMNEEPKKEVTISVNKSEINLDSLKNIYGDLRHEDFQRYFGRVARVRNHHKLTDLEMVTKILGPPQKIDNYDHFWSIEVGGSVFVIMHHIHEGTYWSYDSSKSKMHVLDLFDWFLKQTEKDIGDDPLENYMNGEEKFLESLKELAK